jgi:hypothetical protein
VWDNITLRVEDAEGLAVLVEREALERVSTVEAETAVALASACGDAEGFTRKVALLEYELAVEHQAGEVSKRECLE